MSTTLEWASDVGGEGEFPDKFCPCPTVEPAWSLCESEAVVVDDARASRWWAAPLELGRPTHLVVHDGALVVAVTNEAGRGGELIQRWSPGERGWTTVARFMDERVLALASSDQGLLVFAAGVEAALYRHNEFGLDRVLTLDEWATGSSLADPLRLVAQGDRALLELPVRAQYPDAPVSTAAVLQILLGSGELGWLPEPVAGVAWAPTGWWGRRPDTDTLQRCFDTGCFQFPVATRWTLLQADGAEAAAQRQCVHGESERRPQWAWVIDGATYVTVSRGEARSVDADGDEQLLYSGGDVVDASVHGRSLWLAVSHEVPGAHPGSGRNEIVRVDMISRAATRIFVQEVEDRRRTLLLGGVVDEVLYLANPESSRGWAIYGVPITP